MRIGISNKSYKLMSVVGRGDAGGSCNKYGMKKQISGQKIANSISARLSHWRLHRTQRLQRRRHHQHRVATLTACSYARSPYAVTRITSGYWRSGWSRNWPYAMLTSCCHMPHTTTYVCIALATIAATWVRVICAAREFLLHLFCIFFLFPLSYFLFQI